MINAGSCRDEAETIMSTVSNYVDHLFHSCLLEIVIINNSKVFMNGDSPIKPHSARTPRPSSRWAKQNALLFASTPVGQEIGI
jgi:hypothetical protein